MKLRLKETYREEEENKAVVLLDLEEVGACLKEEPIASVLEQIEFK